ncbi:uroporphyrinogen-III synthase [Flavobacterium oreochromis]|uniref:Uroporphyrinogen III synthase n=2 Tax=Flavobacterium TaxID=237 RepID=A0A246GE95_9FLAO|nr:uroporphyrinogen-III synthase [Flavobacterium oreochromis]OWP79015.1 uroporphyrinogen III synthase [Flavobacterium oreochromis]OWP79712.1 uroporphyrinogen III synthase [Flavobacterium oreochromis]POR30790.1 uroporphyrinogen III synthase [Flavobacterium columnare]QYS87147.1 uroporphyrinogen-III synthase [Flavobacterium oreochromis]
MTKSIRIVSTKKLLISQKQFLLNTKLSVIDADFISIRPKHATFETLEEILLFTSQNAVKAILEFNNVEKIKNKRIFCVGNKTKVLLQNQGFNVEATANYATELAEIISSKYPNHSYTFFSGNLRQDALPKKLKEAKIILKEIEVYETVLTPLKVKTKVDGILFYSPSGVESYLKENKITNEACFCIGKTTAKALEGFTKNIIIANEPSIENVITTCINYFSHKY